MDKESNNKLEEIENKLKELGNIELFNELNTPFEKLEIDRLINALKNSKNIEDITEDVKKVLNLFNEYGVKIIIAKDFCYTNNVIQYMKSFGEGLKDESLFSKNLIDELILNIRYLYFINSKKIEKALNEKNKEILNQLNLDKNGIVKRYFDLNKELINEKRKLEDKSKPKIKENEVSSIYKKMYAKDYDKLITEERLEVNINFAKLLYTLEEYKIYLRYKYIIDDFTKKEKPFDSYESISKVLRKKEKELIRQTKKDKKLIKSEKTKKKRPFLLFFKKNKKEEPITSKIEEISNLYRNLEEAKVREKIEEFVDDDCTIKYVFKIAISYYEYTYNLIQKNNPNIDAKEELQILIDFINQPYKVMLNNVKLSERDNITSIITERYKMLNIMLDGLEENLDLLIENTEKIVTLHNQK